MIRESRIPVNAQATAQNAGRGAVCPGARDDQGFDGIAGGSTKAASA